MTRLVWPNGTTNEPVFTSAYGPRTPIWTPAGWTRPYHVGCDWVGIGQLRAIAGGMVVQSSWVDWAGWQILISLGSIDGVATWVRYCHLAKRSHLNVGDWVSIGDIVGTEGATGQVTGRHLHMEIYRGAINRGSGRDPGTTTDPRAFISARLNNKPEPEPKPEEVVEDEMWKPEVVARHQNGKDTEWMLVHPEIGANLKPGEKVTEGDVVKFRGYMVTVVEAIGQSWGRLYARLYKNAPTRFDRDKYIAIQTEATRVSVEMG